VVEVAQVMIHPTEVLLATYQVVERSRAALAPTTRVVVTTGAATARDIA
jgi:hypothetical protein